MCVECYRSSGAPRIDTPAVRFAALAIRALYDFNSAGGMMHIVTDDYNVEDESVDWCLAEGWRYGSPDPGERAQEIEVGLLLRELTEDERMAAIGLHWGDWSPDA